MDKTASAGLEKKFPGLLLKWHREQNKRQMPWKGEKNPYRIWLSEIILQQTRVEQGLNYYNNFISTFPNIHALAAAPDAEVFKLWEGLGYYSRCRNLLETARFISKERKGRFPDTYEDIKSLKGVGPYTAAAISSFAFDLPHAVIDGNVFRVLSRLFGISIPIDSTEGKKHFTRLAESLLDKQQPALYNQAIMDFGAVVCKPAVPLCETCVFKKYCTAFNEGRINELPVKSKKLTIRKRWFYYLVLEYKDMVAVRQRTGKDIWQQLYEFPLIETDKETSSDTIMKMASRNWPGIKDAGTVYLSPLFKQQLSHQLIAGYFIRVKFRQKPGGDKDWIWVKKGELARYAFPKYINQYLSSATMEQSLF